MTESDIEVILEAPRNFAPAGRQQEIHADRDRKLEAARKRQQIRRQQAASGRNQPSPKDPGGIDESIDLSRDR